MPLRAFSWRVQRLSRWCSAAPTKRSGPICHRATALGPETDALRGIAIQGVASQSVAEWLRSVAGIVATTSEPRALVLLSLIIP